MDLGLPHFPNFDCEAESHTIGQRWQKWLKRFQNFMLALNITDDARKKALLLHYAGEAVDDIFETLPNVGTDYPTAVKALNTKFIITQNTDYETFLFRQMKQLSEENLEQFHIRLRKSAAKCAFNDEDREIKSQIMIGCNSSKIRRFALRSPSANINEVLEYGRINELTDQHVAEMETLNRNNVNVIQKRQDNSQNKPRYKQPTKGDRKCVYCGDAWHAKGLETCRAQGKECGVCGKLNHLAKVCFKNKDNSRPSNQHRDSRDKRDGSTNNVNQIQSTQNDVETSSENGFIFANNAQRNNNWCSDFSTVTLKILGNSVTFIVDSGASVDLLSIRDYKQMKPKPIIQPTNKKIFAYGSKTPMNSLGSLTIKVRHRQREVLANFQVVDVEGPSLLGKKTSQQLDLIRFVNNIDLIENNTNSSEVGANICNNMIADNQLPRKYDRLFEGIGKHKTVKIKLHINPAIKPITQKHRRIPFHLRAKVNKELTDLENKDIIERVPESEATPWVSPVVIIPKKNDDNIRICIDMRTANTAIDRERHVTPTLDDILSDLNGAKHFSKLDLIKGYHQFELHQGSRYITTFSTHKGLFRYKRLNFGINSAAEIFQNEITKIIQDIPGTINVSDDILIYGDTKKRHDEALEKTLDRLLETGLTLNKTKCVFNKENLNFFGHIFSKKGIAADPRKIKAIQSTKLPETPSEVRSLLGMLNFCARYIPNLATTSKPLRELTKTNATWKWKDQEQQAYDKIMEQLTRATSLSYFNKDNETEIWTDASPIGLGALLVQRDKQEQPKIISFASRSLTDTETRYSQIEREALAVTWATERFHLYLYGAKFKIITDHKPLVPLFNNTRAKLSARMERWRLRLQPYIFEVIYKPGKDNPADYLSRHPISIKTISRTEQSAELYVNFLKMELIPKTVTIEEVRQHTSEDDTLQSVIQCLNTGNWKEISHPKANVAHIAAYKKLRNELTATPDRTVLLRGSKLVIPLKLQERIIDIAHKGHQGIVKTKQLIREKVWFVEIDKKVEEKVKSCLLCSAATNTNVKMPLCISELPQAPWERLNIDHKGPLTSGEYLLVVIDMYSRFPLVEIVKTTAADANITALNKMFDIFGIPKEICTDNGPPFSGFDFARFVNRLGIKHRKTTPLWPQANGEVERFNRTLTKTLQIAHCNRNHWKQQMNQLLRDYRSTPHTTTGISPAELMFNRPMRTQLPGLDQPSRSPTVIREIISSRVTEKQEAMKRYYDSKHKLMKSTPQMGSRVLVRQSQPNKMTTPFDPDPYTVTDIKGSMITVDNGKRELARNASLCKVLPTEDSKQNQTPNFTSQENKENETGITPMNASKQNDPDLTAQKTKLTPEEMLETPTSQGTPRRTDYNLRKERRPPARLIEQM